MDHHGDKTKQYIKYISKEQHLQKSLEIAQLSQSIVENLETHIQNIRNIKDVSIRKGLLSSEKDIYKKIVYMLKIIKLYSNTTIKKEASKNMKSGFAKTYSISESLSRFTNWSIDDKKSRNDVTRFICDYIKQNNLRDENDKRIIIPDDELAKLLGSSDKTSYNMIQKNLQHICFVV